MTIVTSSIKMSPDKKWAQVKLKGHKYKSMGQ